LRAKLSLNANSKIIVVDFGSRGGAGNRWAEELRKSHKKVTHLGVGGEVVADSPERTTKKCLGSLKNTASLRIQINASEMRSQAMRILGKSYFENFKKEWDLCKEKGVVNGLRLVWGEGMGDWAKTWEKLCQGESGPDKGLVFTLSEDCI
jgi:hypothetical protein